MHVIRLRDPWTVTTDMTENACAIVYKRAFHRPTGAEQQSIQLRIALWPGSNSAEPWSVAVSVNGIHVGVEASVASAGEEEVCFDLIELQPFNRLELRIVCSLNAALIIPPFGTFAVRAVELRIL